MYDSFYVCSLRSINFIERVLNRLFFSLRVSWWSRIEHGVVLVLMLMFGVVN